MESGKFESLKVESLKVESLKVLAVRLLERQRLILEVRGGSSTLYILSRVFGHNFQTFYFRERPIYYIPFLSKTAILTRQPGVAGAAVSGGAGRGRR